MANAIWSSSLAMPAVTSASETMTSSGLVVSDEPPVVVSVWTAPSFLELEQAAVTLSGAMMARATTTAARRRDIEWWLLGSEPAGDRSGWCSGGLTARSP